MSAPTRILLAALASAARAQETRPASRADDAPRLEWRATEYLGRLSAGCERVGLAGTDLGVSFETQGRLVFLFGDSWTLDRQDWDADSVAWTPLTPLPAVGLPTLTWATRERGRFLPLVVPGVTLGGMNVPVEGCAIGDRTWLFFDTGWDARRKRHSHSVLAHCQGVEFGKLSLDHSVPSERFLNVSVVPDGTTLWIFGTGHYRQSAIFLARVAAADVADRARWRYWPRFLAGEERAEPIVAASCAGELSVRRDERSGWWLLAYNCSAPRGIVLHQARSATGPWSAGTVIFDPERDHGYGWFMHRKASAVGYDDGLSERGREEEWGGEYGPYLVPAWSEFATDRVALVYTLSSWNPYQVHVLRSWLIAPGAAWTPPAPQRKHPSSGGRELTNASFVSGTLSGWTAQGDAFALARHPDGGFELTTFVPPARDAVRGTLHQDFTVPDDARELRFAVKGGTESVQLLRGRDVLRCTRGRRTNDRETPVRWTIDEFRGATLRLQIEDASTEPWGFVTVRGFELVR